MCMAPSSSAVTPTFSPALARHTTLLPARERVNQHESLIVNDIICMIEPPQNLSFDKISTATSILKIY